MLAACPRFDGIPVAASPRIATRPSDHPGRDIHGLAKIVDAAAGVDGQRRAGMQAHLEADIIALVIADQIAHCAHHADGCRGAVIAVGKRRHDCVTHGFDHGARVAAHDLFQRDEMILHEAVGGKVALSIVQRGRTFEVGEQQGDVARRE